MKIETIVVNFNSQFKRQICFLINDSKNYKVSSIYDILDEVKNIDSNNLLIVSLNIETYVTDFLSIHKIISSAPGIMVVIISNSASKEIISNAFVNKCAAIVDKQHFQIYCEFILENIFTFRGFYVSPYFTKYLFEETQSNPLCLTLFLSKTQNDIVYYLTQGYAYLEISDALNLSINTIKRHIKLIYQRLSINSKHELIDLLQKGELTINPIIIKPTKSNMKFINVTEKENKILTLLNKKKTVKEIATELSITQISTKYYIRKLKQKKLLD